MKIIDLSQPLNKKTPNYPGDKAFLLEEVNAGNITVSSISTSLHVGTHLDVPRHMLKDKRRVKDFPLDAFIGNAIVFDLHYSTFKEFDTLEEGDMVLLRTGYGEGFFDEDYYLDIPIIDPEIIERLVAKKIKLFGLDTPSPDIAPYPLHHKLFGADIVIVENLVNLQELPLNTKFKFYAIPLKIDAEGSLVRAFAILD